MPRQMAPRARRRPRWRVRWSRLGGFLLAVYLVVTFGSVEWRIFQAQRRIARLEQDIAVQRQRALVLEGEIAFRETDEYIELVARRELGLVRPGEIPVLVGGRR